MTLNINHSFFHLPLTAILLVVFSSFQVSAATINWTGGGDGTSWSDDDNWDSATRPDPNNNTDDITIDCSCAVDFDEGEALDILGTLNIAFGTTLDLNNEDLFVGDATYPDATLTNDGTITNVKKLENGGNSPGLGNGPYVINSGTINADNLRIGNNPGGGYFTNTSAGTVNVDNGIHMDGTLCNQGLMNLGGEFFNHGGLVDCCGYIETPDVKVDDNTNRKGTFLCIDICDAGSDPGFKVSNDNVDSLWVDDIPKYNNVISTDENDTYICGVNRNGVTGPPAPEYPGGVIPNLSMWLKADQGTDSPVDGANVSIWSDRSANGNFVQQLTPNFQPIYRENITDNINFNPIVDFDGANDVMSDISGILRDLTHTDINVYSVVVTDQVKNSFLFKENTTDNRISATIPWGNNNIYWDAGSTDANDRLQVNWGGTTGTPYLWSNLFSTTSGQTISGNRQAIIRNGLILNSDNTASTFTGTNSQLNLGSDLTNEFDGKIAEFIVYLGPIDATQHNQIESYLAIKYGITLDNSGGGTDGDYMASDGTTLLWDADANTGTYHNDVAGIGRDDLTGLDQQQSMSINSDAIVTMNKGVSFSNDKDYILWGNDNGAIATTTTGANPVFDSRLERTWISSVTGTPGNVTVTIDFANDGIESNYGLHVDSDGDFTTGATTYLASSFSGNSIIFENVNFSNGDFFTLGIRQVAPGNVSNNLALWLKSDIGTNTTTDGDRISNWNDQSASSNDIAQATSGSQPLLRSNATENINYYPMVDFDGNNDVLSDATGILGAATYTDINVYSVMVTDAVQNSFLFNESASGGGRISATIPWGNNKIYWDAGSTDANDRLLVNWGGTTGAPYLWINLFSNTSGQTITATMQAIIRNGLTLNSDNSASDFTGNNSAFNLGSDLTNEFDGKIAEMAIYTGPIDATEHNKIESYLAIKYAITLDNSGGGADGDYIASDGTTTLWDADDPAGYQNEIIGIGRDNKSGLNQKQSHHQDDSLRLFIDALAPDNASNTGTIANDISFITIGHNGAKQRAQDVEMPPGIVARFGRIWKVTNTNFDDDFSLEIEWDNTDAGGFDITMIRLLVDMDDDFSDATILSSADGLTFAEGSIIVGSISTSHIPKNSTSFITIASVNWGVPLPIELISFDASVTDKHTVELSWQTASEINNDFFTIERSKDAEVWKEVRVIDGAGNSSEKLSYTSEDTRPYSGISYYRLKQTDFDGQFTFSDVKVVTLGMLEENSIKIYPNPGADQMTIEGNKVELADFALYNIYGHNVKALLEITDQNASAITIDISRLSNGIYTLKTKNYIRKIIKQ